MGPGGALLGGMEQNKEKDSQDWMRSWELYMGSEGYAG